MKQLRQSKFKKGTTEYENISSPNGEVKAFQVNSVSGNLEYTTDYTNFSEVGGGQEVLTGATDPTTATVGEVGQFYLNTTTNKLFQCQSAGGGSYTWGVPNVNALTTDNTTQSIAYDKNIYTIGFNLINPNAPDLITNLDGGYVYVNNKDSSNRPIQAGLIADEIEFYKAYQRYHQKFPSKSGTFAMTSDIPTLDSTPTANSTNGVTSGGVYSAIQNFVPSGINYLTTAPTADNTDGDLKIVVLSSEPATKYNGYLYIWEN